MPQGPTRPDRPAALTAEEAARVAGEIEVQLASGNWEAAIGLVSRARTECRTADPLQMSLSETNLRARTICLLERSFDCLYVHQLIEIPRYLVLAQPQMGTGIANEIEAELERLGVREPANV